MTGTADFLVEIGTEELPPKALAGLERAFADGIRERVSTAGLASGALASFASPRRLAVLIRALQLAQPARKIEKRGPPGRVAFDPDGQPT
ncbi:MAG: glycine--tRNA ligase subunit beta, partial [Gammaproteobacteria bacterium]